MGHIDCDTHVVESQRTWDYLDPDERDLRPRTINGFWRVEDLHYWTNAVIDETHRKTFSTGSVDLTDPGARIRRMDELGVDVHVMFPTFWLMADILSPALEAALARSYNRWMAECTADSKGRLLWALQAPVRTMDRTLAQLEFGRRHGAVPYISAASGMASESPIDLTGPSTPKRRTSTWQSRFTSAAICGLTIPSRTLFW